jgi:hypothetical protein
VSSYAFRLLGRLVALYRLSDNVGPCFARTGIVGQYKAQRLARQHRLVDGSDLMRQRLHNLSERSSVLCFWEVKSRSFFNPRGRVHQQRLHNLSERSSVLCFWEVKSRSFFNPRGRVHPELTDESPTAITHDSSALPVFSSVWQSHGNP